MTTPALRALKQQTSLRELTLLASPSGAMLAPHLPDIDQVVRFRAPWVKQPEGRFDDCKALVTQLGAARFDAAVIFTVYSQNPLPAAMVCHMAGIPRVLAHVRENPYMLVSDLVQEREPEHGIRHEVRRQLDLVAHVGARANDERLVFRTLYQDRERIRRLLEARGIQAPYIVVHTGATAASRRYSAQKFAQVLRGMAQFGRPLVLTGSAHEHEDIRTIIEGSGLSTGVVNLAGELSLGELGALLQNADLLISNNTGPVHLAAALQTPVVDLYALTNPQHTPWQVPHRLLHQDVPCKYCYRSVCPEQTNACLEGVTPDSVVAAAAELLSQCRARARRAA